VRPRNGDCLPVTAGGVTAGGVGIKLQPPDGDGRAGVPANGSGWSVSWTMHITPHVQSEVDEWLETDCVLEFTLVAQIWWSSFHSLSWADSGCASPGSVVNKDLSLKQGFKDCFNMLSLLDLYFAKM